MSWTLSLIIQRIKIKGMFNVHSGYLWHVNVIMSLRNQIHKMTCSTRHDWPLPGLRKVPDEICGQAAKGAEEDSVSDHWIIEGQWTPNKNWAKHVVKLLIRHIQVYRKQKIQVPKSFVWFWSSTRDPFPLMCFYIWRGHHMSQDLMKSSGLTRLMARATFCLAMVLDR